MSHKQQQANAAAPELLAACKFGLEWLLEINAWAADQGLQIPAKGWGMIALEAAIAKAEAQPNPTKENGHASTIPKYT